MSDLTDFLLERIAEDEAVAVDCLAVPMGYSWRTISWLHGANREHGRRHDPARVLAECEAKRAVVARETAEWRLRPEANDVEMSWNADHAVIRGEIVSHEEYAQALMQVSDQVTDTPTLRILAAVYSDHPDYRPEWRP